MREPTAAGGAVFQVTELMFEYQVGALLGSPAKLATSARGRSITCSVVTSTFMASDSFFQALDHGCPAARVRCGGIRWQLLVDHTDAGGRLAFGFERDRHKAGAAGVARAPREGETVGPVDLDVLAVMFDPDGAVHHDDAEPSADAQIHFGVDRAGGRH